jgi:hypothetical protein
MVGGIYSPNHQTSRLVKAVVAWRTGQSGAPPDTVRCACHVTQPLDSDRWSFCPLGHRTVRWCTGQALFTVPADDRWREVAVAPLAHRTVRCATGHCPVNYSGGAPRIPEGEQFRVGVPGAPDPARCARPGHTSADFSSLFLSPFSVFLLVCCEPLAPV